MALIVISGKFLTHPINGIPRYAFEIVKSLDKLVSPGHIEIVVPQGYTNLLQLTNIKIVESKPLAFGWDIFVAERYASKNKYIYVNFTSKGCFYKKSIVCLHDIRPLTWGDGLKSIKTLKNKLKVLINCWLAVKNSEILVTVSEFEKKEIINYFKLKNKEIQVIGNGWEHMNEILSDNTVFEDYQQIRREKYYLSVSSIAPHKNFKWIVINAKINPNNLYVIVGKTDPHLWSDETGKFPANVLYLGFQEDAKVKALMENSKALIFPSFYEGFGIPPLEALACGTMAIVSDIPVMHEIYEDSVSYIDPLNADCQLSTVTNNNLMEMTEQILQRYTWEIAAKQWVKIIQKMMDIYI